jgi:hypothetical protein
MCNVRICSLGERKIWSVDLSNFLAKEAFQFCIEFNRCCPHGRVARNNGFDRLLVGRSTHNPLSPTEGEVSWIDQIAGTKAHD